MLAGSTITSAEVVRRVKAREERIDDPLQVGMRTYLDLDELSRAINHSCDPNAGLRRRSELFALRDIHRHEEVTYDYSTTIAPTVWFMKCACGSGNCRSVIADLRSIPSDQLRRYKRSGALQRYMKELIAKPGWRTRLPPYERQMLADLGSDAYE